MDPREARHGAVGQTAGYEGAGPTIVRMLLGARLRAMRESAGIGQFAAGKAIQGSESKICRMERGQIGVKLQDVMALLSLYQVSEGERAALADMARHASTPGWWRAYSEVIPSWFEAYLGLEWAADIIRDYQVQFIPGLLQTEDYARAVLRIGAVPEQAARRRVAVRMHRQQILRRSSPPHLWVVIDEAALRRPIGGCEVARAQLGHLIEMSRLPHVNIQIAPFSAGGRAIANGPVTLLRFPEAELADLVYLERHTSALYLNKQGERGYYWDVLNRLATEASSPADTEAALHGILRDT